MRSTFYGFEIAKSGLFAAQRSIDLTAHNISNSNTVGYTRQRLLQTSRELITTGQQFAEIPGGYSGAGVRIDGVEQVRDLYLDRQFRRENSALNMWSSRSDALGYIEGVFNETGDNGLSKTIDNFFTSLHTLTTNPESKEYRTNVLQNANVMTDAFRHIATQLADKQADQNEQVRVTVLQINDIAQNIADLNNQIFQYELGGERANDLRDKRNNLLDTLSGLTDISYTEGGNGMVTVNVGARALVSGTTVDPMQVTPTVVNPITGLGNLYAISWSSDSAAVAVSSGSLKGYLDMRDGNSATNIGIPYLMGRLNTLAAGITSAVNTVHNAGWTLPNAELATTSVTGVDFFNDTATVTAFNFSVAAGIKADVFTIATAGAQVTSDVLRGDNTNALALEALQNNISLPVIGSIEGYEKGLVAEIGVETSHSNQMLDGQQTLVDSLENQRQAVSGVSVDEEMANLVKYQHSYEASARVITAIDEYLDLLINRMGTVGR